jgi:hypothetical protein
VRRVFRVNVSARPCCQSRAALALKGHVTSADTVLETTMQRWPILNFSQDPHWLQRLAAVRMATMAAGRDHEGGQDGWASPPAPRVACSMIMGSFGWMSVTVPPRPWAVRVSRWPRSRDGVLSWPDGCGIYPRPLFSVEAHTHWFACRRNPALARRATAATAWTHDHSCPRTRPSPAATSGWTSLPDQAVTLPERSRLRVTPWDTVPLPGCWPG